MDFHFGSDANRNVATVTWFYVAGVLSDQKAFERSSHNEAYRGT